MSYVILAGQPSSGVLHDQAAQASYEVSLRHKVHRLPECSSANNFNTLWMNALNYGEIGTVTHHCQIHSDLAIVKPNHLYRWGDVVIEEMDRLGLVFCSVPMAIKDFRYLTTCGIGDPATRWNPWRRFTTRELKKLPETFTADMIGYGDKYLLHNHALCMFDMRWPGWYEPDENGQCRFDFNFTDKIEWLKDNPAGSRWQKTQDSDDWHLSRQMWMAKARTGITRKVKTLHHGGWWYANDDDGTWEHDECTRENWKNDPELQEAV